MKSRVLSAVPTITFGFAAMALVAYAIGHVTRTEWVWWLAPLTVAVDGSVLLRTRVGDDAAALSPLEDHLFADLDPRIFLGSVVVTGMAAFGAFTGNRAAIVTGAALAVVGKALEHAEHSQARSVLTGLRWPSGGMRRPSAMQPPVLKRGRLEP